MARARAVWKKWTKEELQVLRTHYLSDGLKACAARLPERTESAIGVRAYHLGLLRRPKAGYWPRKPIPTNLSPLVKQLLLHVQSMEMHPAEVCRLAGVQHDTFQRWRRSSPVLGNFVAVCNAAGLDLVLVKRPAKEAADGAQ